MQLAPRRLSNAVAARELWHASMIWVQSMFCPLLVRMLCGRRRELVVSIAIVLASTAGVSSFKHIAHPSGHKAALLQQGITMSKLEVSIFASSDAAAAASPASKPAPTLVQQVRRRCGGLSKCVHDPRLRAALSFPRFRLPSLPLRRATAERGMLLAWAPAAPSSTRW